VTCPPGSPRRSRRVGLRPGRHAAPRRRRDAPRGAPAGRVLAGRRRLHGHAAAAAAARRVRALEEGVRCPAGSLVGRPSGAARAALAGARLRLARGGRAGGGAQPDQAPRRRRSAQEARPKKARRGHLGRATGSGPAVEL
ncbi:hypothetical protein EMIHUDRAFT_460869, partial [Emiliania huxleyi CCMP1516]|uniref:Uncharacterized protein n=2 Tax=Emiliania huxleyi TaxID=2903 RepID=A0A0D3I8L9_EMIH1